MDLPEKFERALNPNPIRRVNEMPSKSGLGDKELVSEKYLKSEKSKDVQTEDEANMEKLIKNLKSGQGKRFIDSCNVIVKVSENIIKEPKSEKF